MSYWGTSDFTVEFLERSFSDRSSTGYKFEAVSLIPNYWNSTSREYIENRDEMIVNNYAQYCSVVKTQVGGSKLVLGGEIDARK